MKYFELSAEDITALSDGDLRELIGRLCEAELIQQGLSASSVTWGGAQEAADGGLDVSVNEKNVLRSPNFIPKSITGYQVKKHSMGKSACTKEMQEKGGVKPIVAELANRSGAYIIVSGKDDCSNKMLTDRLDGMNAAVASLANKDDLQLDFYGRDRIVTWLRQYPGVSLWARHQLGKPLSGWQPFGRWAATPLNMADEFLSDKHPCVFFADMPSEDPQPILDGIKLVREKLIDGGRALRITGLSGVGKTRFVQALFEDGVGEHPLPRANAIYADLGDDLSPSAAELVAYLIANDSAAYLVLDNCPPEAHRQLQRKVASSATKLRLLTIEYDISDDKPEETEVIHLEPVSEDTVSKLVRIRFPELGHVNSNKIAEFSGGNARVAIALASRVEGDETLATLSDEDLFRKLFIQRKGTSDSLLESAEVLSMVYSFNVSQTEFNDELATLGRISGIERQTLHKHHAELLRRQIAQKRGEWRAVLPHALANRLARRVLENLTVAEINAELFKEDNLRLFKSCAHRIGYLHDSDAAKELVESWIAEDAPLHDISNCGADQLICLGYIAPVFPEEVLSALEKACRHPSFVTRSNTSFSSITQLLCQLAYEDSMFDRAIGLLLKFAETEMQGENNRSIVGQMKNLFSLYLSGTEALPTRRQEFVGRLLNSSNLRHREIVVELFNSALESSHWSTSAPLGFGARRRGTGWQPKTNGELLEWYVGFIKILKVTIQSGDESRVEMAKDIIASNFRSLWTFAGCVDSLEEIVREHALGGSWPDIWMAIKNTIHFDGEKHEASLLMRLKDLEAVSAPNDPFSEIKAYALANTWEHAEVKGGNYSEEVKSINEKILKLGGLACSEPEYLVRLGEKLWEKHIDALWTFGRGLARGSRDQMETFEFLLKLADRLPLEKVDPMLMRGFVNEVHSESPALARQMQERFLHESKLKEHFVCLLCAAPLEPWGVLQLIELAAAGELGAWEFVQISYGRVHERISDEDLAKLLDMILELDGGVPAVLQILDMRFHIDKDSDYTPSEFVFVVGRKAIKLMSAMHRDEFLSFGSCRFENVANYCLSPAAPEEEVSEITAQVFEGIESHRLYSFELGDLISPLIRNFPEIVLDNVLIGGNSERMRIHLIFRDRPINLRGASLNEVPVYRLLAWCGQDQRKILTVGKALCAYSIVNAGGSPMDSPQKVCLSDHIKAFLDAATNKAEMINVIVSSTWSSGGSSSLADILEVRAQAFSELLEHASAEVRNLAASKLQLIERSVQENRLRETGEQSRRERRFE